MKKSKVDGILCLWKYDPPLGTPSRPPWALVESFAVDDDLPPLTKPTAIPGDTGERRRRIELGNRRN